MCDNVKEVLLAGITLLEKLKIKYFVIGGVAVGIHGHSRFTSDVDLVIKLLDPDFEVLLIKAQELGFEVDIPKHLAMLANSRLVKLYMGNYCADYIVGETFFDRSAFKRRNKIKLFGRDIYVASREDLILYKLIAKRHIDLADVERIIFENKEMLERQYLVRMAKKISTEFGMPHVPELLKDFLET